MSKFVKGLGVFVLIALLTGVTFGMMTYTGTGFVIINDGERGVLKSGTQYNMTELTPGYHFFIPIYQTVSVETIRPKLINYSLTEADKEDSTLLLYEAVLKGIDQKGIGIKLALSIEVKPKADQLAEMFRDDGDFENSFYKKVLQPNREAVQSTLSRFNVDTIMDKRSEVEATLTKLIQASYAENPYFELVGINLKDIVVPDEIRTKQLEVQSANQDASVALNQAEAVRAAAQGAADAILIKAKAEAEANGIVSTSLTPEILRLKAIEKWDGSVPHLVGSADSKFIFPVDTGTGK